MKVTFQAIENFILQYPIEHLCPKEQALFLDIETTGFTARSSNLYLIGCAYYSEGSWRMIQWMAENPSQQKDILEAFFSFAEKRSFLFHFNGNQFDLPYLTQKCAQLELPYSLDGFSGCDIYRRIFPYKAFLGLLNLKQKTIESFLSIDREDRFSGGELIAFYQDFVSHPTQETCDTLLLHNREDVLGMLEILPILSYFDAFHESLTAQKVQANHYLDVNGNRRTELMIYATLAVPVPKEVSVQKEGIYARLSGDTLTLRVPVYEEELKYFYSNYKEYYYLPKEDMALHKSVGSFVDKDHRENATARNCYTRKHSAYLLEWDALFTPFFKRSYEDHDLFFELTDDMKRDREAFATYASHVLSHLASIGS